MRNFCSERVRSIPPSGIRKFFDIAQEMDDVISLGVGEPDFDTPWNIREAAIRSIEQGQTAYTSNTGLLELRQEIQRYLEESFGVSSLQDAGYAHSLRKKGRDCGYQPILDGA